MSDILEEVIRDSKEEKKYIYFKKSLPIILAATIIIVISMSIRDYFKSSAKNHNMEIGDLMINAFENTHTDSKIALEGLEYIVKNAKNNAKDVSILAIISTYLDSNKTDKAIIEISKVIDGQYQDLTKSYCKLLWVSIMMDKVKLSDDDRAQMESYFKSFTEKSPFFGSAKLYEALFYKATDKEKSKSIVENLLSSHAISAGIKSEASALMSNLNLEK